MGRKLWMFLVISGAAAVATAVLWWRLSTPSGDELRHARINQTADALSGRIIGTHTDAVSMPHAATTGPIIVAIVGAFAILCGVILLAARRD